MHFLTMVLKLDSINFYEMDRRNGGYSKKTESIQLPERKKAAAPISIPEGSGCTAQEEMQFCKPGPANWMRRVWISSFGWFHWQ